MEFLDNASLVSNEKKNIISSQYADSPKKNDVEYHLTISKSAAIVALIALSVSFLCIICPIRSIIEKKCVKEYDENAPCYKEKFTVFTSDYDKENPLTAKSGKQRFIDLQIELAGDAGEDEKKKEFIESLKA